MLKILKIVSIILFSKYSYAQDKIFTHKNDSILCKITEIGEKTINYKYNGEDLVNSVFKNYVSHVKFASGRIQKFSDKVIINEESDWQKVTITNSEYDIAGLAQVEKITVKLSKDWVYNNTVKFNNAKDELKKEAAKKGCHIILLLTTIGKKGQLEMIDRPNWSITGVIYKY
ncbi:hypothetical protein [Flavobacterium piscis]|uniref:Uncharacterized protein n=1 Tax=Flavobacterium piscis TaxID=1114874 RepID=A0ABU1Y9S9_9FLAO|nr:hypothetical protein [Flavobacterium piscis]MDR7210992.1 hypothetical protein [Flavobacterium piscis]